MGRRWSPGALDGERRLAAPAALMPRGEYRLPRARPPVYSDRQDGRGARTMQAVVIILQVLVLTLAIAGLVGERLCTLCGAAWSFGDAGSGSRVVGISLPFAVPSYFLIRAPWHSLDRHLDAAAEGVAATVSAVSEQNEPASSRDNRQVRA